MGTSGFSVGFVLIAFMALVALAIAWVLMPLLLLSMRRQLSDLRSQGEWRNRMVAEILDIQRDQANAAKAASAASKDGQAQGG